MPHRKQLKVCRETLDMAKLNGLGSMNYAQLLELRDRLDEALVAARDVKKRQLRAEIEALTAKAGLTLADVLSTNSSVKTPQRGKKVTIKYRNPKDPSQTWSGRGRQPNWLVGALKKGQKIESFLV